MDPELKQEIAQIHALVKDNHDMLRALRRHQWWSFITTVVFWLIVTIAPFYLYQQYVQPLVSRLSGTEEPQKGFQLPAFIDVQKVLNSLQGK